MTTGNVLVVNNEPELPDLLHTHLEDAGMKVWQTNSGKEALHLLRKHNFDLIILDILLDDLDGFEVLQRIRSQHMDTPVLLLSADQEIERKVYGFHLGADDVVTKPFNPVELVARVQACIRRSQMKRSSSHSFPLAYGPFVLYKDSQLLYKNQTPISLSEKETRLLYTLMKRPNQAIAKTELFEKVWGHQHVDDNSLNVYINYLRRKIEDDPRHPTYIQTVWGLGYRFSVHSSSPMSRHTH